MRAQSQRRALSLARVASLGDMTRFSRIGALSFLVAALAACSGDDAGDTGATVGGTTSHGASIR